MEAITKKMFDIARLILESEKFKVFEIVKFIGYFKNRGFFDNIPSDIYDVLFGLFGFDEFGWDLNFHKNWNKRFSNMSYLLVFIIN